MKVVEINAVKHGSTGNIMLQIARVAREQNIEAYTFSGSKTTADQVENHSIIGNNFSYLLHRLPASVTGLPECFSIIPTLKLVKKLKQIKPDIIHLHNMHGWYINIPILFSYIKKNNIKTVWTLHDCWAFTAQCSHFTIEKCEKWKTGCYNCPRYKLYPSTFFDNTKKLWKIKKKWFEDIENLTIVTPSEWLANLLKTSFLSKHPVKVINNGIDLSVFKPCESDFRKKHNIEDKLIILGVASGWGFRKGLDVFIELSKYLNKNYTIVLVGTDEKVDDLLPENIVSIHRTENQTELAKIYSEADIFLNPTREETFPTVNIEALACGTPVITANTGGSPEIINNETGLIFDLNDIKSLANHIEDVCETNFFDSEKCINRSKNYDMYSKFKEYIELYKTI